MASPLGGMRLAPAARVPEGTTRTHVNVAELTGSLRDYEVTRIVLG
jgi:hypothetical protein